MDGAHLIIYELLHPFQNILFKNGGCIYQKIIKYTHCFTNNKTKELSHRHHEWHALFKTLGQRGYHRAHPQRSCCA